MPESLFKFYCEIFWNCENSYRRYCLLYFVSCIYTDAESSCQLFTLNSSNLNIDKSQFI